MGLLGALGRRRDRQAQGRSHRGEARVGDECEQPAGGEVARPEPGGKSTREEAAEHRRGQHDRDRVGCERGEGHREHRQELAGHDVEHRARRDEQCLDRAPLLLAGDRVDRRVEGPGRGEQGEEHKHRRRDRRQDVADGCRGALRHVAGEVDPQRLDQARRQAGAAQPDQASLVGEAPHHGEHVLLHSAIGWPDGREPYFERQGAGAVELRQATAGNVDPGIGGPLVDQRLG